MRIQRLAAVTLMCATAQFGAVINTNSVPTVTAFQAGATINNFEGFTGAPINSYASGNALPASAKIFNEISGVQFSVGGTPGSDKPAVYELQGAIAADARSGPNVLGGADFVGSGGGSLFSSGSLIEIFFPVKVSRVGFWLNPSLGNVQIIAADTNFAFSGINENTLESAVVTAGNFVGIERAASDIGGFKVISLSPLGFTVDDFTFDGASTPNPIPEPTTWVMLAAPLAIAAFLRRSR